jgi:hypothetical protein
MDQAQGMVLPRLGVASTNGLSSSDELVEHTEPASLSDDDDSEVA